jgi:predicted ATPase
VSSTPSCAPVFRALIVTDLVGSTTIARRLGEARVGELWARHDRVARDLLRRFSGLEIDKSDGFLLLFEDVAPAVAFASAYHAALAEIAEAEWIPDGFAARAGIHFGPVTLRENPPADVRRGAKPIEVEGVAKAIAARTMSVAIGGQTLLTADARARIVDLPDDAVLMDHGLFKMKGVQEPLSLCEVGARARAPLVPPTDGDKVFRVVTHGDGWRPARDIPTNLPAERDSFFGRSAELRALAEELDGGARLVSVLGPPGTGKSRFARRFASQWCGDFPGGAWLCDVSAAGSLEDLCRLVDAAADIPSEPGDAAARIGRVFAARDRTLLLLDNCERVVEHGEASIAAWLSVAPALVIVATSRTRLRLRGERIVALEPLPIPPPDLGPAVSLFAERARQVQSQFELNAQNITVVADIVRRLDGLPLAIELAAARVRSMDPSTIRDRLGQRFRILVGGQRDAASRQATLRGAIDWSWDLCSPAERHAAAALSVFRGGFDLAAAEAVIGDDDPSAPPAFELVEALADKSLVCTSETPEGVRFDLYESIREYLTERLAPEDGETARARHAAHYARTCPPNTTRAVWPAAAQKRAVRELDNLKAANAWAATRGLPEAPSLAVAVGQILALDGRAGQTLDVLDAFASSDPALTVAALTCRGLAALDLGRTDAALAALGAAVERADACGDPVLQALSRERLAFSWWRLGRDGLEQLMDDALSRLPAGVDPLLLAEVAFVLGIKALNEGRVDEAAPYYERFLAAAEASQEPASQLRIYGNLSNLRHVQGRDEEAIAWCRRAIALARDLHQRILEVLLTHNLSEFLLGAGRDEEAVALAWSNHASARALGVQRQHLASTNLLVTSLLGEGDVPRASSLCTLGEDVLLTDRRHRAAYLGCLACIAASEGSFDEARRALAEAQEESEALRDPRVSASVAASRAWCDVYRAAQAQEDPAALLTSARALCGPLPRMWSRFAARVLRIADEVEGARNGGRVSR